MHRPIRSCPTGKRRLVRASTLALAFGVIVALTSVPAGAEEPQSSAAALKLAREQFGQALALQTAGDWAGALALLKQVAAVKSTPQVRFNIALCEENLGRLVAALGDYELAAADARAEGADQVAEEVEARREALSQRIPKLTLKRGSGAEAASIALDGVSLGDQVVGSAMPTDPGPHTIEATAPGFKPFRKAVRVAERQSETVEIVLEPEPVPARPAVSSGGPAARGRSPIYGYVAGGVGITSLAASGVFFGLRAAKISDLDQACNAGRVCPPDLKDDIARGKLYTTMANVTLAVGAVALVGGVVLVLTSAPRTGASVALAPAAGGAQLLGRF